MKIVWLGIALAFGVWTLLFATSVINFWVLMTAAVIVLAGGASIIDRDTVRPVPPLTQIILWGAGSAALLYGVFWVGDIITSWLPHQDAQVSSVYDTKSQAGRLTIGLLLMFIIGPGEEIFWRGFVQRIMVGKWGFLVGWILATAVYCLVHVASLNPILMLAALVCGGYWGLLYRLTGSVWPGVVSHALWDTAIFVIWPLR